jgi:hypothetical protein
LSYFPYAFFLSSSHLFHLLSHLPFLLCLNLYRLFLILFTSPFLLIFVFSSYSRSYSFTSLLSFDVSYNCAFTLW